MRGIKTLILCMLLLPVSIYAEDTALLIGIGQYPSNVITNLRGIYRDIPMMRQVVNGLGFQDQNVQVLMDTQATLNGMSQALQALSREVNRNDRVLIYFSGHGTQVPDENGDELDQSDEVLVAHDTELIDRQYSSNGKLSGGRLINVLRDDEFGSLLAAIPSENIYVLIDACNSGTTTRSLNFGSVPKYVEYPGMPTSTKNFEPEAVPGSSIRGHHVLLSAAQDDEYAQDSSQGGVFTRGIYNAVLELQNNDESVTMRKLEEESSEYISQNLPSRLAHSPKLTGEPKLLDQDMAQQFTDQVETLWDILERRVDEITQRSSQRLAVHANQEEYRLDEYLTITCNVNMNGYINVLNVNRTDQVATVLYPNQYHRDNRVRAGTTITIPGEGDPFQLPAKRPLGEQLIVVFVSSDSLNAYEMDGRIIGPFGLASKGSLTKNFVPVAASSQWRAGKIVTHIVE